MTPAKLAEQLLRLSAYPEFPALRAYTVEYANDLLVELAEARGPEAQEILARWQAAIRFLRDIGMIKSVKETVNAGPEREPEPESIF